MSATVEELMQALTLEEKAGLCSGADFWRTKAVERLGIPAMMVSDGPPRPAHPEAGQRQPQREHRGGLFSRRMRGSRQL